MELAISEYSQPLDSVLQWSSGRVSVIWRRRIERFKMLEAAYKAPVDSGAGTRDRDPLRDLRGPRNRSRGDVVEHQAPNMEALAHAMNIRPEPYPGNTPWNQGSQ